MSMLVTISSRRAVVWCAVHSCEYDAGFPRRPAKSRAYSGCPSASLRDGASAAVASTRSSLISGFASASTRAGAGMVVELNRAAWSSEG